MFYSILFDGSLGETLSLKNTLIILACAVLCGVIMSIVYVLTHRKNGYTESFITTLIILPAVVSSIILLIGNNAARALSLAGAFTIVRFRSQPGSAQDITHIFISLAVGLACGLGYVGYAFILEAVLLLVLWFVSLFFVHIKSRRRMSLKILVPEDLNYQNVFEPVISKYTISHNLERVRTTDFGTVYQLIYTINVKKDFAIKEFMDEIRVRNGNMNILLTMDDADPSL